MSQAYSDPKREHLPHALPDVETFYLDPDTDPEPMIDDDGDPLPAGWYYWACFPGCLPDSDPFGPYGTEEEAIAAAQEDAYDDDDDQDNGQDNDQDQE